MLQEVCNHSLDQYKIADLILDQNKDLELDNVEPWFFLH